MKKMMFELYSYAMSDDKKIDLTGLDSLALESVLKLAKKHDLAHLVGYSLKSLGRSEVDHFKEFENLMYKAVGRYLKISRELEAISSALETAEIPFIPLKGAVIRKYYKEPWFRTSCDIDILVSGDDLHRVKDIFVSKLGYTYHSEWNYEVSFFTPQNIHIELHHTLNDENPNIDAVLSTVWSSAKPIEGHNYHYQMPDEMYYFYHIVHMVKHFVNGGCGIRPFMDIWVLNNNCPFDKEKRYNLLDKAGIRQFAEAAEQLSEVWFGDSEHTEITEKLERFVLTGGTYGTLENRVAVQQAITGGKISYILSRIFLPFDKLKLTYPNLEKHKYLFPFYQVKRWFRFFSKEKSKESLGEVKSTARITSEQEKATLSLLQSLGIK